VAEWLVIWLLSSRACWHANRRLVYKVKLGTSTLGQYTTSTECVLIHTCLTTGLLHHYSKPSYRRLRRARPSRTVTTSKPRGFKTKTEMRKVQCFNGSTVTRHYAGHIGQTQTHGTSQSVVLPQRLGVRFGLTVDLRKPARVTDALWWAKRTLIYTGHFSYICLAPDIFSIKRFILELARSNHYTGNTCFRSFYHRHALSSTLFLEQDQTRRYLPCARPGLANLDHGIRHPLWSMVLAWDTALSAKSKSRNYTGCHVGSPTTQR